ncbi:MAG: VOC family protein [Candidatus Tectomicrobia bacterium]|uniref:VOC family protein n=1 Tax=Tectimicrobiota bacterium TaxID=2528274 RepID=A0A932CNS8_UNCTE|nr:VOC family protein [Candidatus Tectomicrobia bacterium]
MEAKGRIQVKEINQVCVVVKDLQASMERYTSQFGIGPWRVYTFEPPAHTGTTVRGRPVFYRMRLALAQVGSLMWELIEPLEGESIYAEFLREKGEGLHHVACFVEDFDRAIADLQAQGVETLQRGNWHEVTYAYMDTVGPLGAILEFVKIPAGFVFPPPEAVWPPA